MLVYDYFFIKTQVNTKIFFPFYFFFLLLNQNNLKILPTSPCLVLSVVCFHFHLFSFLLQTQISKNTIHSQFPSHTDKHSLFQFLFINFQQGLLLNSYTPRLFWTYHTCSTPNSKHNFIIFSCQFDFGSSCLKYINLS